MIEVDLVDREEVCLNGEWYCIEYLCAICPKCGNVTIITVTQKCGTEYIHAFGEVCYVPWTEEPVLPGFELCVHLISMPSSLR